MEAKIKDKMLQELNAFLYSLFFDFVFLDAMLEIFVY